MQQPHASPPCHADGGPAPPGETQAAQATGPTLSLRALLDRAGAAMLGGLPGRVWVAASVAAVKTTATGWALELTDSSVAGPAAAAQLRAFLGRDTCRAIGRDLATTVDPMLLVGLTTHLLVAPSWSPRWHLQGRILGLSAEAGVSLARRAVERLREELQRSGLSERQRALSVPPDVTRVAVIAPSGAAGHADIAGELARWQAAGIVTVTTHAAPFEGERAAAALVAALTAAAVPRDGARPDLILIVRGGGAASGLRALDHEMIVRAVCRCPVPVVTGVGHAIDRILVDEVAWRATDTPSKAVALVGRLIGTPAARARNDVAAIAQGALSRLATQTAALAELHRCATEAAHQRIERAGADLAQAWTVTLAAQQRVGDALEHHADELERLRRTCGDQARTDLTDGAEASRRTLAIIVAEAGRRAASADAGAASLAAVTRAAAARSDAALTSCDALWRAVLGRAGDHFTVAQADLAERAGEIATTDVPAQLGRGFAVVTDRQGYLIRTPAAARAAGRVILMLAGGAVAATVDQPAQSA